MRAKNSRNLCQNFFLQKYYVQTTIHIQKNFTCLTKNLITQFRPFHNYSRQHIILAYIMQRGSATKCLFNIIWTVKGRPNCLRGFVNFSTAIVACLVIWRKRTTKWTHTRWYSVTYCCVKLSCCVWFLRAMTCCCFRFFPRAKQSDVFSTYLE